MTIFLGLIKHSPSVLITFELCYERSIKGENSASLLDYFISVLFTVTSRVYDAATFSRGGADDLSGCPFSVNVW